MNLKVVTTLFFLFAFSVPSAAQQRAWFFQAAGSYSNGAYTSLTEVAITDDGRSWEVRRRIPLPRHFATANPVLLGGGRYIVWAAVAEFATGPPVLVCFDTQDGQLRVVPFLTLHAGARLAVDRRSGRLVVLNQNLIYLMDPAPVPAVSRLMFVPPGAGGQRTLAVGGGRIFISSNTPFGVLTDILDAATGNPLGGLFGASFFQFSRDERTFYAQQRVADGYHVERFDTDTLAFISGGTLGPSEVPLSVVDDFLFARRYERSIVQVRLFDGASLAPRRESSYTWSGYLSREIDLIRPSRHSPFFLRTVGDVNYFGCRSRIDVIDPGGTPVYQVPWQLELPCRGSLLMIAPPDAPTGLQATVTDRTVTLAWDPPANIGDYEIEAGSQPGLRDLAVVRIGAHAQVSAANVGPGTYYVRVRAINELGISEPSSELRIVVP